MPDDPTRFSLPDAPNIEWLRKHARRRLEQLRASNPGAQLAEAQFDLARQYGFASWRALKAHVDSLSLKGQVLDAVRRGEIEPLASLLDAHPDLLHTRAKPYGATLLHAAAQAGHLSVVDLLLRRGLDVNARERGDNTYPMHWAAAMGRVDIVRRLADAGGDVVGHGDDHELEVIGWATCWNGCDDDAHRAVVEFLISRGARHHIFSAIAMNLGEDVRRIVRADPAALNSRMSRNENNQTPLHFAVRFNRPAMVALLLELGADPLAVDGGGMPAAVYASTPDIDRPIMERIRDMTSAELVSAGRGARPPRGGIMDLVAVLALGDFATADTLVRENAGIIDSGAMHIIAKRGDVPALEWLLAHGANPNVRWAHWDSDVTPLHLAVMSNHPDIVRRLIDGNADAAIADTKHQSDALGWAEFFNRPELVAILKSRGA